MPEIILYRCLNCGARFVSPEEKHVTLRRTITVLVSPCCNMAYETDEATYTKTTEAR